MSTPARGEEGSGQQPWSSEREVGLSAGETSWVLRNQAAPSDVTELQHQHEDTLETNASSTVGRTTPLETIKVVNHRLGIDLGLPHLLLEEDDVVDTLTAGKDLFASDEDIVGIGQLGVLRIGYSIEGGWRGTYLLKFG